MIEYLVAALDHFASETLKPRERYSKHIKATNLREHRAQSDLLEHCLDLALREDMGYLELARSLERSFAEASAEDLDAQLDYLRLKSDERLADLRKRSDRAMQRLNRLDAAREEEYLERELKWLRDDLHFLSVSAAVMHRLDREFANLLPASHQERWRYVASCCSLKDSKRFLECLVHQILVARRKKLSKGRPYGTQLRVMSPMAEQRQELTRIVQTANSEAIVASKEHDPARALLASMNDSSYDYLLDKIAAASDLCKRYRRGEAPPEELAETLSPLVGNLDKFLRHHGLRPMLPLGQLMRLSLEESLQYDYQGSEFEQDSKEVEVLGPGWEHQGTRIARPRVREVRLGTLQA